MTDDHEALKEAAIDFRNAIEQCKDNLSFSAMEGFPGGCCKIASLLLGRYLVREHGYRPINFISGIGFDSQQNVITHLWLEYSGTLIDITADQFPAIDEPVIVTDDRSWHDRDFPEQTPFDLETEEQNFDTAYQAKLDADYDKILGVLLASDPSAVQR